MPTTCTTLDSETQVKESNNFVISENPCYIYSTGVKKLLDTKSPVKKYYLTVYCDIFSTKDSRLNLDKTNEELLPGAICGAGKHGSEEALRLTAVASRFRMFTIKRACLRRNPLKSICWRNADYAENDSILFAKRLRRSPARNAYLIEFDQYYIHFIKPHSEIAWVYFLYGMGE